MSVFVTGAGWVTAAGFGQGRGGIPFAWEQGDLPAITRKQVFPEPHPHFGRLDRYSKLGIAAITMALRDAGIERMERTTPVALIASTVYGCLETDINFFETARDKRGSGASPHLFAYTLSNTFLGEAAIEFGFTGATFLLNEAELGGAAALRMSIEHILSDGSETIVTGVCDPGPPLLLIPRPARSGALFFVLSSSPGDSQPYGRLHYERDLLFFEGEPVADMIALAERLCGK
jgi:3-oxoacyl-[acyl-carrier-protein] synthase II